MFKKEVRVALVMKRLLAKLGLITLLKCVSPAEEDFPAVTDSANNPAAAQGSYPARRVVKGTLVHTELSTGVECDDSTIMYVTDPTNPISSYAAFCFPYGHADAQLD